MQRWRDPTGISVHNEAAALVCPLLTAQKRHCRVEYHTSSTWTFHASRPADSPMGAGRSSPPMMTRSARRGGAWRSCRPRNCHDVVTNARGSPPSRARPAIQRDVDSLRHRVVARRVGETSKGRRSWRSSPLRLICALDRFLAAPFGSLVSRYFAAKNGGK